MTRIRLKTLKRPFLPLAVTALFAACSHVGQGEFDTTMAQVRDEMRSGDAATAAGLNARVDGLDGRVDVTERIVASLERDVSALAADFDVMVERMDMAMRFNTPIFFGYNESSLGDRDHELLNRFSTIVRDYYPDALITVEGFTDSSGSADYNRRLGQRRAESVKDYLVTAGRLDPARIRTVSYGEDASRLIEPGIAGPGESGWQNRRVVLVVDQETSGRGRVAQSPY